MSEEIVNGNAAKEVQDALMVLRDVATSPDKSDNYDDLWYEYTLLRVRYIDRDEAGIIRDYIEEQNKRIAELEAAAKQSQDALIDACETAGLWTGDDVHIDMLTELVIELRAQIPDKNVKITTPLPHSEILGLPASGKVLDKRDERIAELEAANSKLSIDEAFYKNTLVSAANDLAELQNDLRNTELEDIIQTITMILTES